MAIEATLLVKRFPSPPTIIRVRGTASPEIPSGMVALTSQAPGLSLDIAIESAETRAWPIETNIFSAGSHFIPAANVVIVSPGRADFPEFRKLGSNAKSCETVFQTMAGPTPEPSIVKIPGTESCIFVRRTLDVPDLVAT